VSQERAAIVAGENVVGPAATIRVGVDPAADLRADPAGVSRQHSLIVSASDAVMLHDLSSTNGTFVDGVCVTAPAVLIDGCHVRFGRVSFQYCALSGVSATGTIEAFLLSPAGSRR
jgi:pSer/pThr/pTyr-binding forkhead associated (FHA) protein